MAPTKSHGLRALPNKPIRAEIMFDVLMTLLIILSFPFPAIPWPFGMRWGLRGVWFSTGAAVVTLLCFLPILAIFVLGPIWIVSALLTVMSAMFAHYKFSR